MDIANQVRCNLQAIEQAMRDLALWQATPPPPSAFSSIMPFYVDSMLAVEWLQWVLLPRIYVLLDAGAPLPTHFFIAPYFEEALKDQLPACMPLLTQLRQLDSLLNGNPP